jgi:hypothetical protein
MARRLGVARRGLLILVPVAALLLPFWLAPMIPAHSPFLVESLRDALNLFPLVALGAVPVLAYRWSGNAATAAWTTALALLAGALGVIVAIAAVWPAEN